jgi:predicted Holliday junction resolvase-like endonuclease
MQHQEMLLFFQYQREIFGICPCCDEFIRLSDCKIYKDERKSSDWLDKLGNEERKLDTLEAQITEDLKFYNEEAREKGRKEANKKIKKVDKIFTPQKLNPDDAKVIFHPVDFVVFNGMKNGSNGEALKSIILLDGERKSTEHKQVQNSIIKTIENESYEWITLRVDVDGNISEE